MAMKRSLPCPSSPKQKRARAFQRYNSETQFPGKLHDMMEYVEQRGLQSTTISWIRNGTGIIVRDPERLVLILSKFFGQTKYRSFLRQLNMWHFQRITTSGPDKGGFMHPFFVKNRKSLCSFMSRFIDPNDFQPSPLSLEAQAQNSGKRISASSSRGGTNRSTVFQEKEPVAVPMPQLISSRKEDETGVETVRLSPGQVSQRSTPRIFSAKKPMLVGGETGSPSIERFLEPRIDVKLKEDEVFDDIAAVEDQSGQRGILPPRLASKAARFDQDEVEVPLFSPSSLLLLDYFPPLEEVEIAPAFVSGDEQNRRRNVDVEKSLSSLIDSFVDPFPLDGKVAAYIPSDDGGLVLPGIGSPARPETVQILFEELRVNS